MAISRLASAPKGGRPTRRIAPSCAGEASGMSEKSIPRRRRIARPLLAARPVRADDADAFAIVWPPHGVGHDEHTARRRVAQSQKIVTPPGSDADPGGPGHPDRRTRSLPLRTRPPCLVRLPWPSARYTRTRPYETSGGLPAPREPRVRDLSGRSISRPDGLRKLPSFR